MRRLKFPIRSGHAPRLDRRESKTSRVIGGNAPVTRKARLIRFFLRILGTSIFSQRVCLPDFNDPVGYWSAVAIQDAAFNFHAITGNSRSRQIVPIEPREADVEKGADGLPGCSLKTHDFSPCAGVSIGVLSRPLSTMSNR